MMEYEIIPRLDACCDNPDIIMLPNYAEMEDYLFCRSCEKKVKIVGTNPSIIIEQMSKKWNDSLKNKDDVMCATEAKDILRERFREKGSGCSIELPSMELMSMK